MKKEPGYIMIPKGLQDTQNLVKVPIFERIFLRDGKVLAEQVDTGKLYVLSNLEKEK